MFSAALAVFSFVVAATGHMHLWVAIAVVVLCAWVVAAALGSKLVLRAADGLDRRLVPLNFARTWPAWGKAATVGALFLGVLAVLARFQ